MQLNDDTEILRQCADTAYRLSSELRSIKDKTDTVNDMVYGEWIGEEVKHYFLKYSEIGKSILKCAVHMNTFADLIKNETEAQQSKEQN